VFKTCHDAAEEKDRRQDQRAPKIGQGQHRRPRSIYGPGNQLNVSADGGIGDGLGAASNANLRIALQALAFQLAWDIVMAHLVPGYMIQKAITLAEGFSTNPLIFMYFFDNKYFMQPGGQKKQ
jgi:hypothetical protein